MNASACRFSPSCSFEDACTIPTVFITVDTALNHIAAIGAGTRVLVHAAAGGVGLAALQVIKQAGAVPVATAGGPAKRALLRTLGCRQVVGSRDTMFTDDVSLEVSSALACERRLCATAVCDAAEQVWLLMFGVRLLVALQGGAQVALNTLTSSGMVAATLATLSAGAAFIEISKRDIWSPARVAQGGFRITIGVVAWLEIFTA
jgi:Zn-dependent alcohol dehydrogenase